MKKNFILSLVVTVVSAVSAFAGNGWPANYGGVMLQGFYWDSFTDSKWATLTDRADELSKYFDLIWIPNAGTVTSNPAYESTTTAMGYSPVYYLKMNTIFGTEAELRTMINTYKAKGTGIIEDVVINHKNGETGWCDFANESVTGQNTRKTYTLTWDNTNYSGICNTDEANKSGSGSGAEGKITGAADTGDDFDGCRDLDHTNATVQQNLITYQDYLLNELGFAGFRLDMVKGYSGIYTKMYNNAVNPTYSVGEYWDSKDNITNWIKTTDYTSAAFDFPLHNVLQEVFDNNNWSALSDKSFTADVNMNRYSVTFVDNHDTFRSDENKVNNSWSAANSFILAMPGTPCIFLPHYTADPTHIQAMITARKACGVNNQSEILQQYQYNNGYVIETHGTNGKVYLQLGDATGQDVPDGYTLVASATDQTPYKFYAQMAYTPSIASNDEISLFYETSASAVKIWAWNSTTNFTGGVWDNRPSMIRAGRSASGKNIFKWTYDGTETGSPTYVSFQADGASQSSDLEFVNHGYYVDGTYSKTISNVVAPTSYTVYFDNSTGNWDNVYCYTWDNTTGKYVTAWPGTQLTEKDPSGRYFKYTVSATDDYSVIFSNGDKSQTNNLVMSNGTVYRSTGVEYESYLPLVDGIEYTGTADKFYSNAYYSRSCSTQWGTLCLPFAYASNDDVQYYTLKSYGSEKIKLTELSDVKAGQPVIFKILSDADATSGKYSLTVSADNAVVKAASYGKTDTPVDGWTVKGTYSQTTIQNGTNKEFYIASNTFWNAVQATTVNTFRAWMEAPSSVNAKAITIDFGTDGIEETHSAETMIQSDKIYNLYGQQMASPKKGQINIINGRKVLVR